MRHSRRVSIAPLFRTYLHMAYCFVVLFFLISIACKPSKPNSRVELNRPDQDCEAPMVWNASVRQCVNVQKDETTKGQHALKANTRSCSQKPGVFRLENGQYVQQGETSEIHIFLRCVFHGGNLNQCIQHNQCQATLTAEECEKELDLLQKSYPDIDQKWQCSSLQTTGT